MVFKLSNGSSKLAASKHLPSWGKSMCSSTCFGFITCLNAIDFYISPLNVDVLHKWDLRQSGSDQNCFRSSCISSLCILWFGG